MRVIIAGSRTTAPHALWRNWRTVTDADVALVQRAVTASGFHVTEVVTGCANSIDTVGAVWAARWRIPVKEFYADWDGKGRGAGYVRNAEMAQYAAMGPAGGALIAPHSGESRGTAHMIRVARNQGLQVYVELIPVPAGV